MTLNWPMPWIAADLTQGPPNVPGANSLSLQNGPVQTLAASTKHGRQYELGHAETGTATLTVNDPMELLNPANTSSVYNSGSNTILPYRCDQIGFYWNAATLNTAGNLANASNIGPGGATPYDPSFETTVGWLGNFGSATTIAQSTVQAFNGTHSCAVTYTASTDVIGGGLRLPPGQTVTVSCYVYVPAGYTVSLVFGQFAPTVTTYGTNTSSSTGAWQRLAVTATSTQAVQYFTVRPASGTPYPFTMYLDAVQVEFASSASAFTTSGPKYYPIHTGYVERWPRKWEDAGFRGTTPLDSVDGLSVLSRTTISQSYAATVLADGPYAYVPFNDGAVPFAVELPQGGQPFIGGTLLGNSSSSVNFGGDTFLDGTPAVTVVQQNSTPPTSGNQAYITYAAAQSGILYMNTQGFTIECWVRFSSGTAYFGAAALQPGETLSSEAAGPSRYIGWYTNQGRLNGTFTDPNGGAWTFAFNAAAPWGGYPDGQWHYLTMGLTSVNQDYYTVDTRISGTATYGFTPSQAIGISAIVVEATTYFGDPTTEIAVANMALYPYALSNTQIANHYNRGIGHLGENSMTRASRLLAQYWGTNGTFTYYTVGTGIATLDVDYDYDPIVSAGSTNQARTMLDVLQEITDAENGFVYVNAAGVVVVEGRETRLTSSLTSSLTFGENVAGGEYPYLDIEYDYDPTYVYSEAQLQNKSGYTVDTVNSTSQTAYGQRILNGTIAVADQWQLQQAALFYTTRYAKPAGAPGTGTGQRIQRVVLDAASSPRMFNAVLPLELGNRVTVKRRTSAGLTMSNDYYVESIAHDVDWSAGKWQVTLELSPFWHQPWICGDSTYSVCGSTTIATY